MTVLKVTGGTAVRVGSPAVEGASSSWPTPGSEKADGTAVELAPVEALKSMTALSWTASTVGGGEDASGVGGGVKVGGGAVVGLAADVGVLVGFATSGVGVGAEEGGCKMGR